MPQTLRKSSATSSPARPRFRFGLRAMLIGLVLLVLVPLLCQEVLETYLRFERRAEMELQTNRDLAEATGAAFLNYLDNLWNTELAIGLAIMSELPPKEVENYLKAQLPAHPTVDNFTWVSPEGIILVGTNPSAVGISCADREHIQAVRKGAEHAVSGIHINRVNANLNFFVARGIRIDGQLKGIVVASILPDRLGPVISGRKGTSSLGLVDSNGLLVYRRGESNLPLSKRQLAPDAPAWPTIRRHVPVLTRDFRSSIDKATRLGAFVPIPRIGWAAVATTPTNEAYATAWADTWQDILVLSVVVCFSLLAAVVASTSILKRARALEQAALDITRGDLTARSNLRGSDELAVAGQAFDTMAARIQGLDTERIQFLQTAAHELRNPMASVTGLLSLILKRVSEGRRLENEIDLMEVMKREVLRLSSLLNEILEAFRAQEGQVPLKWRPVGMVEVVSSALEPFLAMEGSHTFAVDLAVSGEVTVLGDRRRLEDLMRNLLSNAVKYSPDGGGIEVKLYTDEEHVYVSVSDSGIGIPQDQLSRVFERFYRATNLAGRDPGGMGLGLYICKDIVLAHGGGIWAESDGTGATILVELPRYERRSF